jgi:hypothetical protein
MVFLQHSCHYIPACCRTASAPGCSLLIGRFFLLLQRQATDSKQWFSHLQHEIDILSTVSRNRNVVQVSCRPLADKSCHWCSQSAMQCRPVKALSGRLCYKARSQLYDMVSCSTLARAWTKTAQTPPCSSWSTVKCVLVDIC